ncbi:conserved hypothetical protein [Neospora caninum Liverpool]|uniref:Uncharacterized protein n=1 Tax=Neospora caninum (strain Liverpool) TaxID=572307 RepID=F0VH46_NEOCL|nr:conserved hypothetical protein [Neospora caninum Liverpool]CBZ53040.1 conserved hypothetical protein [Neospora caninum Liverpool]CEL67024.1 TPA: hypothetical protein BN1204_028290 [Neospora caninum Liverpool]|eukprot:XP_003883072.1 conserved hypothetical protein [Neospora caninum Liverpool]
MHSLFKSALEAARSVSSQLDKTFEEAVRDTGEPRPPASFNSARPSRRRVPSDGPQSSESRTDLQQRILNAPASSPHGYPQRKPSAGAACPDGRIAGDAYSPAAKQSKRADPASAVEPVDRTPAAAGIGKGTFGGDVTSEDLRARARELGGHALEGVARFWGRMREDATAAAQAAAAQLGGGTDASLEEAEYERRREEVRRQRRRERLMLQERQRQKREAEEEDARCAEGRGEDEEGSRRQEAEHGVNPLQEDEARSRGLGRDERTQAATGHLKATRGQTQVIVIPSFPSSPAPASLPPLTPQPPPPPPPLPAPCDLLSVEPVHADVHGTPLGRVSSRTSGVSVGNGATTTPIVSLGDPLGVVEGAGPRGGVSDRCEEPGEDLLSSPPPAKEDGRMDFLDSSPVLSNANDPFSCTAESPSPLLPSVPGLPSSFSFSLPLGSSGSSSRSRLANETLTDALTSPVPAPPLAGGSMPSCRSGPLSPGLPLPSRPSPRPGSPSGASASPTPAEAPRPSPDLPAHADSVARAQQETEAAWRAAVCARASAAEVSLAAGAAQAADAIATSAAGDAAEDAALAASAGATAVAAEAAGAAAVVTAAASRAAADAERAAELASMHAERAKMEVAKLARESRRAIQELSWVGGGAGESPGEERCSGGGDLSRNAPGDLLERLQDEATLRETQAATLRRAADEGRRQVGEIWTMAEEAAEAAEEASLAAKEARGDAEAARQAESGADRAAFLAAQMTIEAALGDSPCLATLAAGDPPTGRRSRAVSAGSGPCGDVRGATGGGSDAFDEVFLLAATRDMEARVEGGERSAAAACSERLPCPPAGDGAAIGGLARGEILRGVGIEAERSLGERAAQKETAGLPQPPGSEGEEPNSTPLAAYGERTVSAAAEADEEASPGRARHGDSSEELPTADRRQGESASEVGDASAWSGDATRGEAMAVCVAQQALAGDDGERHPREREPGESAQQEKRGDEPKSPSAAAEEEALAAPGTQHPAGGDGGGKETRGDNLRPSPAGYPDGRRTEERGRERERSCLSSSSPWLLASDISGASGAGEALPSPRRERSSPASVPPDLGESCVPTCAGRQPVEEAEASAYALSRGAVCASPASGEVDEPPRAPASPFTSTRANPTVSQTAAPAAAAWAADALHATGALVPRPEDVSSVQAGAACATPAGTSAPSRNGDTCGALEADGPVAEDGATALGPKGDSWESRFRRLEARMKERERELEETLRLRETQLHEKATQLASFMEGQADFEKRPTVEQQLRRQVADLEQQTASLLQTVDAVNSEAREQRRLAEGARAEKDEMEQEAQRLSRRVAQLERSNKRLRSDLQTIRAERDTLLANNEALSKKTSKLQTQAYRTSEAETQLQELREEKGSLLERLQSVETERQTLQKDLESLHRQLRDAQTREEEILKKHAEALEKARSNAELLSVNSQLRSQLEEVKLPVRLCIGERSAQLLECERRSEAKETYLQGDIAEMKTKVESLETALATSTSPLLSRLAAAERQAAAAREEAARLSVETRKTMEGEMEEIRSRAAEEKRVLSEQIERQKAEIDRKDAEGRELQRQLEEALKLQESAKAAADGAVDEATLEALRVIQADLQEQLRHARNLLKSKDTQVDALREEVAELREEIRKEQERESHNLKDEPAKHTGEKTQTDEEEKRDESRESMHAIGELEAAHPTGDTQAHPEPPHAGSARRDGETPHARQGIGLALPAARIGGGVSETSSDDLSARSWASAVRRSTLNAQTLAALHTRTFGNQVNRQVAALQAELRVTVEQRNAFEAQCERLMQEKESLSARIEQLQWTRGGPGTEEEKLETAAELIGELQDELEEQQEVIRMYKEQAEDYARTIAALQNQIDEQRNMSPTNA